MAATKGVLRTTMQEAISIASEPIRAGRSALAGRGLREGSPPPPSPRAVSRGIRNTLSMPLLVSCSWLLQGEGQLGHGLGGCPG